MKATTEDIIENKHNLDIKPMNASQIPRALDDIDFGIIPGSLIHSAKVDKKKILLAEDVIRGVELVFAVDEKNKDAQWVEDIVEAYKSDEFKKYMQENNKDDYWHIPEELK